MVRVLAVTGGRNVPSSIFRVRQYLSIVNKADDVHVKESMPLMSCYSSYKGVLRWLYYIFYLTLRLPLLILQFRYDVIWLQREIVPTLYTLERFLIKPIIYDVDDAVYIGIRNERTQRLISQRSSCVVVSTQYLAEWYSHYSMVRVIPTVVNCERYKNISLESNEMCLGWIGTSNNFWHLDSISYSLSQFLEENIDWKIKIVSDRPYTSELIDDSRLEYVEWSLQDDVKLINSFKIGIMPLVEDEWTKGKASFKLLQYMSCGVHAVASITGNNYFVGRNLPSVRLVDDSDWLSELNYLAQNMDYIDTTPARERVRKLYSLRTNQYILKEVFYEIYNSSRK